MSEPSLRLIRPQAETASNIRTSKHRVGDRTELELARIAGTAKPKTVKLPLGKLVPLLMDAVKHERVWLQDFAEDPIQLDADLYDVLLAYQSLRERAA